MAQLVDEEPLVLGGAPFRLERCREALLASAQLFKPGSCLVLAATASQRRSGNAHESGGMEGAFEKRHAAEHLGQAGECGIALDPSSSQCKKHNREIGPGRLAREPA